MSSGAQRHNKRHNTGKKRRATPTGQLSQQQRELLMWLLREQERIQQSGTPAEKMRLQQRGVLFIHKVYLDTGEPTKSQSNSLGKSVRALRDRKLLTFAGKTTRYLSLTAEGQVAAKRFMATGGLSERDAPHLQLIDLPSGPLAVPYNAQRLYRKRRREAHEKHARLTERLQGWQQAQAVLLHAFANQDSPEVWYVQKLYGLEISLIQKELTGVQAVLNRPEPTELMARELDDFISKLDEDDPRRAELIESLPPEHFEARAERERRNRKLTRYAERISAQVAENMRQLAGGLQGELHRLSEEAFESYRKDTTPAEQRQSIRDEAIRKGWQPPED